MSTTVTDVQPDTIDASAAADADRALKAKHRAMWALGDYTAVAREIIPSLGPVLVDAAGIRAGQDVLDVAAGEGNVAIPAARTGARVTASDLTPELIEAGRRRAAEHGDILVWETADAEALPYADNSFDSVVSCVGVMFAPHHAQTADELVRVTRPGGTIGLLSWTPSGFIGQMFATMKPYAPPPPPGASPAPLWGDPAHLEGLFGERVEDVVTRRRTLRVDHFATPEAFRDYFKRYYGPTIAVYRSLAEDAERTAALDQDLAELGRRFDIGGQAGGTLLGWEYLLYTARVCG